MKTWATEFWANHGDRIVFMAIVTAFGFGFYFMNDMKGEAKTLLIAVATLALNRARTGPKNGNGNTNRPSDLPPHS